MKLSTSAARSRSAALASPVRLAMLCCRKIVAEQSDKETAVTEDELREIIARTEAANAAWVRGDWENGYGALISASNDASIYGPFGGPATVGGQSWAQRSAEAVKQFMNGTSKLKVVSSYASGDLLVLVTLEEQTADLAGKPNRPWSLRVTQVYRREDGQWKVVHRHADPLVRFRAMPETLALIEGS